MQALPAIIRESVKPMENIEGIKILQVNGLGGPAHDGGPIHLNGSGGGGGNLAEEVVNNALRYRAQAPILDSLLQEIGLSGGDLQALAQSAAMPKNGAKNDGKPRS
jgi:uncharacterized membrane protein YqiK